jgi:hypothetical protein
MSSPSRSAARASVAYTRHHSTPPPIMSLSSNEFSRMMLHSNISSELSTTFFDKPVTTLALRHYHYLTKAIKRLEQEITRHTIEQQDTFERLIRRSHFQERVAPIVTRYRREMDRSASPPSTPSINTSSIRIRPEDALARIPTPPTTAAICSPILALTSIPLQNPVIDETGTARNPILVTDDDNDLSIPPLHAPDLHCLKCNIPGHHYTECPVVICSHCGHDGHEYGPETCPLYDEWRLRMDSKWVTPAGRVVSDEEAPSYRSMDYATLKNGLYRQMKTNKHR